jgi:hypothetical protein
MADTTKTSNDPKKTEAPADAAERHASDAAHKLDAKLSGPLAPLETALNDIFGEKASVQLPKNIKDLLVQIAPWLALISAVLGVVSAFSLWQAAHYVNEFNESLNRWTESYGVRVPAGDVELGLMFWLSIIMTLVFAALALLAFPGLKARKKVGWNLMFYSLIANVAYGVVSLFYSGGGASSFVGALIGSAIGAYILFQIRSHYLAK